MNFYPNRGVFKTMPRPRPIGNMIGRLKVNASCNCK